MSWLKKIMSDGEGDGPKKEQAKKMKLLAVGALLGVGLILWGASGKDPAGQTLPPSVQQKTSTDQPQNIQQSPDKRAMAAEEEYLANKIRDMLQQVEGAGDVQVTVRLESSTQTEYAINTTTGKKTTQERDQSGGTRTLTEDTDTGQLVLVTRNGEETPVLSREIAPEVAGVLVVARGAGDPAVKAELFRATQVALGIEPQKVIVMAKKAGE
ncbi:hypothetical protein [Desulforamulus ruminis]|uniref:Stage III sporulation protein AG n=1 Tax=Desulforamulus ruminis (strain ATCC 23193 / DSM 2154 / NCIMB 8452 / DL) TaxID=696281 RepID=F6DUB0_DESRL|nr:hypothetical protein [Desulforamulus ruminis]AEG61295.1 hypothetical protein Desru_3084 [Desulforamulus ruminis DSM 2154]